MGSISRLLLALGALLAGTVVQAQSRDAQVLYLRTLAASCAQCHGTDGRAPAGSAVPSLAGRPRAELLAQLQGFKAGTRPSTVMGQLARGFSDAQLEQLAGYFAGRN